MSEHRDDEAGGSRRWLLRGAALGIAAAGGASIATAPDAQATSLSGITNSLNVQDYGAKGDGLSDDTGAFGGAWLFLFVVIAGIVLLFTRVYAGGNRSGRQAGHRSRRRTEHRSERTAHSSAGHSSEHTGHPSKRRTGHPSG